MRHKSIVAILALLVLSLVSICALGQVLKGSISGTITDPEGAIVRGAQVRATNTATGTVLTTSSDSSGLFRFSLLPPGSYRVEVNASGFQAVRQNNVAVAAGRDTGMGTIKLAVGPANTTVEVTTSTPLVETTQSQVTNTFEGNQLSTFAGVQENQGLDNLALFVPGVVSSRDNNFSNTNGAGGFSSNGLRGRNNDQQIDGQNNNDNSVGGPSLFVTNPEFVQQYVIVTNQFGPEFGRNSGSVVNVVTKSGTNAWHGSIFGNENNSYLNSMTNFEKRFQHLSDPPRLNDEFGGFTIGGPFIKNRLFFFGGFDQELVSQRSVFSSGNLTPTPTGLATLASCFPGSSSLSALTKFGPYGISGGNPTPDPTTLTSLPITGCSTPVEFAGVSRTLQAPSHIFDWLARVDLQLGGDTISGRYIFNRNNVFNTEDNGAAGYVANVPQLSQDTLISWTHNLSSHMVNELRGAFGRLNVEFGGNTIGNTEPTAGNLDQAVTNVSFQSPGLLGFGPNTVLPQGRIVNTYQAQDNWNYVLGKHQLKAGVNYTYQRSPNTFLPNINGQFRFANWSDFFANTPNRVRIAQGTPVLDFREHDTFLYAGDDWKITQGLTLNLGVTWSYYGQPANLFNNIDVPRESNPATVFWNPGLPLSVRTFPKIPAVTGSIGPSIGFAYSPQSGGFLTGNGKTTIRGGYRLLYDPPFYNIYLNIATSAPQVFLQSFQARPGTVLPTAQFGLPATPTGPNVRAELSPALTPGVLDPRTQAETSVSPNFGPDRVHTWTLGIEREITKNSAVEARYVGNHAFDLFQSVNGNPFLGTTADPGLAQLFPNLVPPGVTPCPASSAAVPQAIGRVNCNEGVVRERTNSGFSNYNAFQFEFRANNLAKQLTMRLSYTFSKTLDNASEIFGTGAAGNTVAFSQNPFNFQSGEYSFSGLDYPHQGSLLFTEQLPFFRNQHGLVGRVLGGWTISGNYILASGQRYTPSQAFAAQASSAGNFYDSAFLASFVGVDTARPFLSNTSAPATAAGVFAGDACTLFAGSATDPACTASPTQLISLNAVGQTCGQNPHAPCNVVPVANGAVRYILNGGTAQTVFGTPFGTTPRNIAQDAISNIANFSVFKQFKVNERAAVEIHATLLNALNHPNFLSVDPFLEDAGLALQATGFGDPTLTNSVPRRLLLGAKFTF